MMRPSDIPQCLSFTVRGHWGHFRRIEGNSVKNTYRVMPRTTVAGMLAAIVGCPRNTYYDVFAPDSSAVAIEVDAPRTINIPVLALSTNNVSSLSRHRKGLKMGEIKSAKDRQRDIYEVLVEPEYRIHVWVDDEDFYADLRDRLEAGTSVYTPTLGLSEYIASIDYHGVSDVTPSGDSTVDSAVPGGLQSVRPDTDARIRTERSPGFMAADNPAGGGFTDRRTTGFIDWAYTPADDPIRTMGDVDVASVTLADDGAEQHVVFV